jgi:hypothetical protein
MKLVFQSADHNVSDASVDGCFRGCNEIDVYLRPPQRSVYFRHSVVVFEDMTLIQWIGPAVRYMIKGAIDSCASPELYDSGLRYDRT